MTFFDPLSDPCWPASDTTGDRTSYLASYLAAQKPTKRQPDIYQAVFNYYLAVLETRLLMVHPSLVAERGVAPLVLDASLLWRLTVVVQAHTLSHTNAVAARLSVQSEDAVGVRALRAAPASRSGVIADRTARIGPPLPPRPFADEHE